MQKFDVFEDARGTLIPIDFESLGIAPVRAFAISSAASVAKRGGHENESRKIAILVVGSVEFILGVDGSSTRHNLTKPGEYVEIPKGLFLRFELKPESVVIFLADEPWQAR